MIWIDDGAGCDTSKTNGVYYWNVRLICMDWSIQSQDLNPIENL